MRLGVNIDHIATIRNARGENDPSLIEMLFELHEGGADTVTMHLREDRRHIQDEDIFEVKKHSKLPINLEIALTQEMIEIACRLGPSSVCLVPEKREEITTEGGLDVGKIKKEITEAQKIFSKKNIQLFIFVEPTEESVQIAKEVNAHGIEIHTGTYARSFKNKEIFLKEVEKIKKVATLCLQENILFHAGHGLNYHNIYPLINIKNLMEVNIGHSIISRALRVGLRQAVSDMKLILNSKQLL